MKMAELGLRECFLLSTLGANAPIGTEGEIQVWGRMKIQTKPV